MKSFFSFMKGNVLIITATRAILFFSTNLFGPYLPLYVLALGGSATDIGFAVSLASLATLFVYPVAGYLADSRGRVKLICAAFYLRSVPYILYSTAQNWKSIAVGEFTRGLSDFQAPAMGAIMADSLPPGRRGIGFAAMNSLPQALGIIAPSIGGYVIVIYGLDIGIRYLGICAAVGCIVVATLRLKYLKETLKEFKEIPTRNMFSLVKLSYQNTWETIRGMPRSLLSLTFIMILSMFFSAVAGPFWIVYATKIIKLTELDWGLIQLLVGILSVALALPVGAMVDKYSKKKVLMMAITLSIPPVFLYTYCSTFLQVLIVLLCITISTALLTPTCQTIVADAISRERRGRFDATFGRGVIAISRIQESTGFVPSVATTLGALSGGLIYSFNPTYPWLLLSATLVIILVVIVVFFKELEKAEL